MRFTTQTFASTAAGKIVENQRKVDRRDNMLLKLQEDPHHRYKSLDVGYIYIARKDRWYWIRSRWEVNIMCYLEYLQNIGEIKEWEYETETFYFDGIKRGTNNYKPDFPVTNNDDQKEYWEVKGFMDKKSATKLKRMAKYHPAIKMVLVDQKRYQNISQNARFIPGWGQPLAKEKS